MKEKKINKESVHKTIEEAKAFQSNLKLNLNTLKSKLFKKDSLLEFEPNLNNLSSDSIGYFSFERYNFTDFVKLTRIEIESRLKTKPKDPNFQMTTLDNGNYIIAYPASDYGYDPIFSLINKDLEFIKEIVSYVSITFNCYKNLVIFSLLK